MLRAMCGTLLHILSKIEITCCSKFGNFLFKWPYSQRGVLFGPPLRSHPLEGIGIPVMVVLTSGLSLNADQLV